MQDMQKQMGGGNDPWKMLSSAFGGGQQEAQQGEEETEEDFNMAGNVVAKAPKAKGKKKKGKH